MAFAVRQNGARNLFRESKRFAQNVFRGPIEESLRSLSGFGFGALANTLSSCDALRCRVSRPTLRLSTATHLHGVRTNDLAGWPARHHVLPQCPSRNTLSPRLQISQPTLIPTSSIMANRSAPNYSLGEKIRLSSNPVATGLCLNRR